MDQFIGEIRMFPGNYAPEGWAFCDGQILPISGNEALFSLIGAQYGGDGTSNFALPDLRGRIPVGTGLARTGTQYHLASSGGAEKVTLTSSNVPEHKHTISASAGAATQVSPQGGYWAATATAQYSKQGSNAQMNAQAVMAYPGEGQSHENMMPYMPLSFIIALQGEYPTPD